MNESENNSDTRQILIDKFIVPSQGEPEFNVDLKAYFKRIGCEG